MRKKMKFFKTLFLLKIKNKNIILSSIKQKKQSLIKIVVHKNKIGLL